MRVGARLAPLRKSRSPLTENFQLSTRTSRNAVRTVRSSLVSSAIDTDSERVQRRLRSERPRPPPRRVVDRQGPRLPVLATRERDRTERIEQRRARVVDDVRAHDGIERAVGVEGDRAGEAAALVERFGAQDAQVGDADPSRLGDPHRPPRSTRVERGIGPVPVSEQAGHGPLRGAVALRGTGDLEREDVLGTRVGALR